MALEQALLTWIHITSAAIWVGGSLFIGVVFAPILKKMSMPIEERIKLMVQVGRRFNKLALPALFILIATGMYQAHLVLQKSDILYETSYGHVLILKIILVAALVILYAIHVRIIRKDVEDKIIAKQMPPEQLQKLRKKIIILGEVTVVLSVVILFLASVLNVGGQL
ncbi:MAG: CopD family protein [Crenarchaeota archaeon]|nr:CopD family protein [Thermoproteota archaeon]MDA1125216.1 CopD family protein [Thermoproteota archaeon]